VLIAAAFGACGGGGGATQPPDAPCATATEIEGLRLRHAALAVLLAAASCSAGGGDAPCAPPADVDGLRLNQVQVVGSHNSYRRRTYAPLFAHLRNIRACLSAELDPETWDYDHPPLREQLDAGVRALEIDIYDDPEGGRFYNRQGLRWIGEPAVSHVAALLEPGFKVLHVPDFDYETHHVTFVSALGEIARWSEAHPRHVPIAIHVETKQATVADDLPDLGLTTALPFDAAAADALDAEIRSAIPVAHIITPDEVRGAHATLEEAVLAGGWPTLADARGRIFFLLEGAAIDAYVTGAPGLVGRLMFANAPPGTPHAAVVIAGNPVKDGAAIADLVRRGYVVRTMADAGTVQARTGDVTARDAALASGAQIVTTDYDRPDPRGDTPDSGWTNYSVDLPGGGGARINPVSGGPRAPARICED